ncbi:MAG: ATP-binding protein [Promethearchaeota archaeon]
MNKEQVRRYLLDFYEKPIPIIHTRNYSLKPSNRIQVLIGSRRVGKTFLLFQVIQQLIKKQIKKSNILYLNFEHPLLNSIQFDEMESLFELYWSIYPDSLQKKLYIFIDEPQNLPKWELLVRALQDDYHFPIFITGSSSKLLSKEISTHLRGRTLTNFVYPLSFDEYLKFNGIILQLSQLSTKEKSKLIVLLNNYLQYGGYPEVVLESDKMIKNRILKDLLDLTIYRDLIDRFNIKNTNLVKFLIPFLIQNSTKQISIHKIFNHFKSQGIKIDKNTLYEYFGMLEDISFIHILKKYSSKLRDSSATPYKIYLNDPGFLNLYLIQAPVLQLENHVYMELLRRIKNIPTAKIYYWRSSSQWEIDFVITEKNSPVQAIQVSYSLKDYQTQVREVRSLQKFSEEYPTCEFLIITFDDEANESLDTSNIKVISFWKWSLISSSS